MIKAIKEFIIGKKEDSKEIKVFYAFRFIFFLIIYIQHTSWFTGAFTKAGFSVTGFFILSGLLSGYMYIDKKNNIKEAFKFTVKRVKKFYPLHILLLLMGLIYANAFKIIKVKKLFVFLWKTLKVVLLVQGWWHTGYFHLNGVTWYLCAYIFLTFLTIPIMIVLSKVLKQKYGKLKLVIIGVLTFCASMLYVYLIKKLDMDQDYFLYIFPPARLFEYVIGIITGILLKKTEFPKIKNAKIERVVYTLFEIIALIISYLTIFMVPSESIVYTDRMNLFIIPLIILFSVFISEKGYISKILRINIFVYLGKISLYMFMIHQLMIFIIMKESVHPRLMSTYLLLLVIILASIIERYYANKNKIKELEKKIRGC